MLLYQFTSHNCKGISTPNINLCALWPVNCASRIRANEAKNRLAKEGEKENKKKIGLKHLNINSQFNSRF